MTGFEYVKHSLEQDYGDQAANIIPLLDSHLKELVDADESGESYHFEEFHNLPNDTRYSLIACFRSMVEAGIDYRIAYDYVRKVYAEMPTVLKENEPEIMKTSTKILALIISILLGTYFYVNNVMYKVQDYYTDFEGSILCGIPLIVIHAFTFIIIILPIIVGVLVFFSIPDIILRLRQMIGIEDDDFDNIYEVEDVNMAVLYELLE